MMKRITFEGLFCDIAKCEDTPGGSYCENGTCSQRQAWERLKAIENILGDEYDLDHLRDLLQAEKDGRLVVLPCAIGSEVFTIEESYFDCENCEHGAKARYNPEINRRCCEMDDGEHCPHYIEGHIVEGFTIGAGDAGKPSISAPGEWGYEGLEKFSGIDGKWYPTREEAEAALEGGRE